MRTACALALLVACAPADRPATDSVGASAPLGAAIDAKAQGTWQDGDEVISWTSTVEQGVLTSIAEQVTFGTDGKAERALQFANDGSLSSYRETRTQTVQQPDRSPAPMTVQIEVTFAGNSLAEQRKTVDGAETPIRPYEIDNIRRHARAIFDHVRLAPPAPTKD